MKHTRTCAQCGGTEIYTTTVSSGGGYAPDLLPGAHSWFGGGKLEIYICGACGHFEYFVPERDLAKVRESPKFRRHS